MTCVYDKLILNKTKVIFQEIKFLIFYFLREREREREMCARDTINLEGIYKKKES